MAQHPRLVRDPEALVDAVLERTGKRVVLGLPLGLGKANHFANALYARARADASISLTILTALTLEPPVADNELARRFLEPMQDRYFAGYPRLAYARGLKDGTIPDNIRVHEFYLQPGMWLGNERAQQDYISLNYTHALGHLLDNGVNVIGQLIAAPAGAAAGEVADAYSLSCNPDVSADLLELRRQGRTGFVMVGQVNRNLPFMGGAAHRPAADFDFVLDDAAVAFPLFMPPHQPVSLRDHALGLQVAALVPDGGTLQIGIGSTGDAIANALRLRQTDNGAFRDLVTRLWIDEAADPCCERFEQGLYGLSEMLVEGFLALIDAGVVKREVDGRLIDAGFFMGSPAFYRELDALAPAVRDKIAMMPVTFINSLHGDETGKRAARRKARFINNALMATLGGAVVSDGLENGQVISGVGGQFNFVSQAFALDGARSIITLPATRTRGGRTQSNIRFSYGNVTVPRHLRDIVVTEYGAAHLRGKSDAEVYAAMLNITDSRFQPELLDRARRAGKLPAGYTIPARHCNNTPARIREAVIGAHRAGQLDTFPLGTDFSWEERQLAPALGELRECAGSKRMLARLLWRGWRSRPAKPARDCLQRMGLERPRSMRERVLRNLLLGALKNQLDDG